MRLPGAIRERAKWIDSEANALVGAHGRHAYHRARENERNANSLSDALFWCAVKKVVAARDAALAGVEVMPPVRANACLSCLVEAIAGKRDNTDPPLPAACLACARRRLGFAH